MATLAGNPNVRYCHCGNISIFEVVGNVPEVHLRYMFLTELRREEGAIVHCKCCNTDAVCVEGIDALADLDKVTAVTMMETIDEEELRAQTGYSNVFQMVIPPVNVRDDDTTPDFPPEIQLTLESAVQRQRHVTRAQITDFTAEKKQEFKSWKDEARKQAKIIATVVETVSRPSTSPSPASKPVLSASSTPSQSTSKTSDLFQKSPVTQHTHPEPSPLAAANLTPSQSERPSSPSPPPSSSIVTPPPIILSSSLKCPGSSNYLKPVKRVMFQGLPDEEVHSDAETEIQVDTAYIPTDSNTEAIISVDDELFDFDETIPEISLESDTTGSPASSQASPPTQPSQSPIFSPPLSPFRRRSVEKYILPGDDDDPFDDVSTFPTKSNDVQIQHPEEELAVLSLSKPIAITPPPRSFLAEGLGIDEDEDDGGMKGLIERISLRNTRRGPKTSFADQRMLCDIPGDYYRSVPS